MLGLVDYEVSSESENEEHVLENSTIAQNGSTDGSYIRNLFTSLPLPKKYDEEVVEEEDDEFLHKKADVTEPPLKRIKINIPELDTSKDEYDNKPQPTGEKKKKCGLFNILPAPKVAPLKNTHFLPQSVKKKANSTTLNGKVPKEAKTHETLTTSPAPKINEKKPLVTDSDSEAEGDESIHGTVLDDSTWNELFAKKKTIALPKVKLPPVQKEDQNVIHLAPEAEKPYNGLDNGAFKKLIGHRKNLKPINVIEVEEAKIHPDRDEWLKSLTDPNFEVQSEVKEPTNRTSLYKNHITSLADRALANDKNLRSRWAESRNNRNTTRTKYGF